MGRLAFILLDGLTLEAARKMSWLEKVAAPAHFGVSRAEFPPLSKPAYATLFTGIEPCRHGILDNSGRLAAPAPNLFTRARATGLTSCAAAYSWFYELYDGDEFIPARHRFVTDQNLPIGNGLFYWNDSYPDAELFADAEALRNFCKPDFMLAHCMGIDLQGHLHGSDSREYYEAVANVDSLLAAYAPIWLRDFMLVVTSDHGMDASGKHEADTDECRATPCWLVGEGLHNTQIPSRACEMAAMLEKALLEA